MFFLNCDYCSDSFQKLSQGLTVRRWEDISADLSALRFSFSLKGGVKKNAHHI